MALSQKVHFEPQDGGFKLFKQLGSLQPFTPKGASKLSIIWAHWMLLASPQKGLKRYTAYRYGGSI